MKAMNKAEKIISISDFTKRELEEKFWIKKEKIKTVYLGYDKKIFKEKNKKNARKKLGLKENKIYLLNVGSEENRKNVLELIKAVKDLDVELIRIGEKRTGTKKLIEKEKIENVFYEKNVSEQKSISIEWKYIEKMIGLSIGKKKIISLLKEANYDVNEKGSKLLLKYPYYRQDIMHPVDVLEDVIIRYGYNNIEPKSPQLITEKSMQDINWLSKEIANIMIGTGAQD